MATKKKRIPDLPKVTLPMTGNEDILVNQAGVDKRMKPGDVAAFQGDYIKADGSIDFKGDQSMAGFKLTEVHDGEDEEDAVNLKQLNEKSLKWAGIAW